MTDAELVKEIEAQKNIMIAVATGGPRIESVNEQYRQRRGWIADALRVRAIPDSNPYDDLWAWYGRWSSGDLPSWQSRRTHVTELYAPLLGRLQKAPGTRPEAAIEPTGWARVDRGIDAARSRLATARNEEDYQTVGLLCRETLISLAQGVYVPNLHPPTDGIMPSDTDAKRMLEAYISRELAGGSNEAARKHAKAALDLANTLVHKRTATFREAALCAEATTSVINSIAIVFGRRDPDEGGVPRQLISKRSSSRILDPAPQSLTRESAFTRMNRILELVGAEQQWVDGTFTRTDGDEKRQYSLPTSQGNFSLYFLIKDASIAHCWYVSTMFGRLNMDAQLADIRVLMAACSRGQQQPITFIIVTDDDVGPLRATAQRAFVKMKGFLPEDQRGFFSLEMWDHSTLTTKEKELGLRI